MRQTSPEHGTDPALSGRSSGSIRSERCSDTDQEIDSLRVVPVTVSEGAPTRLAPMPTQSEQKALAFAAIVVLLAGAVRVVRAGGPAAEPTQGQQQGLARQAFAANSAAVAQKAAKVARAKRRTTATGAPPKSAKPRQPRFVAPKGRDTVPNVVGGVSSVPWNDQRGFPPPAPRIDVVGQSAETVAAGPSGRRSGKGRKRGTASGPQPGGPIDLDTATPDAIEALPRIGPSLAHRIVANRDSLGPFRSLDGLRRVKGVGPATIALIGPLVTFSRQTRP